MENEYRNLGLSIVRATEAAALAAGRWIGLGDLIAVDKAATQAMYNVLNTINIQGNIVIGEERRHPDSEKLLSGAKIGSGNGPEMDVIVDAIDGTRLLTQGQPDAISVVALSPPRSIATLNPSKYMQKLVVCEKAAGEIGPEILDAPPAWTLGVIAHALGKPVKDLNVFILNRPRHANLIEDLRLTGARILLRQEADLLGALLTAAPNINVDVMMGIGGAPEGIVAASAVKALRGKFFGRLAPQSDEEHQMILDAGLDTKKIYSEQELASGDDIYFAATGITDSLLLKGVHYSGNWATTHSLVLRGKSDTRRQIIAEYMISDL